jgi:2-polyprenyl-3-methyl-5-hydroxy-6-metoxy-1,4-benzoquinol methylase
MLSELPADSRRKNFRNTDDQKVNIDFPPYVEPLSGEPLDHVEDGDGNSYLICVAGVGVNKRRYPILKGIPRLLLTDGNYADAFGEQWLRWRTTQLDSHSNTTITKDRLLRCLGDKGVEMLSRTDRPTHILEVGCGAGRFTEILLQFPSARVTSLDLSAAVEANQTNCPQDAHHRVVQADIMQAPFEGQGFDMVICLGVIQHTPNPEATMAKLFEQVTPGGMLVIDHYTPEIKRWTKISALLLRPVIKRLPSKARMRICELLVSVFFPVHRAIRHIPFAQQVFSRVSPITTYLHAYPQLPERLQREWAILDTHDSLTDWYKHLRTTKQIESALRNMGAIARVVSKGGNGVEASCWKPRAFRALEPEAH